MLASSLTKTVCAIVVTHQPDIPLLKAILYALRPQVGGVIVVDNASGPDMLRVLEGICLQQEAKLLASARNLGVAGGLNHGIEQATTLGYDRFLLLDQDSLPSPGMVSSLCQALENLIASGERVAGVGPRLIDRRTGSALPFVRFIPGRVVRKVCGKGSENFHTADFLITSGMLISVEGYRRVGPFDASLFIDNVDLEWCFRAGKLGYRLYGVCDATLEHAIGDQVYMLFGRFPVYRHSPLRQYYILRNRLWLYRMPHTPWAWIVQDIPRALLKCLLFGLFIAPRRENLRMMLRGLRAGLKKPGTGST